MMGHFVFRILHHDLCCFIEIHIYSENYRTEKKSSILHWWSFTVLKSVLPNWLKTVKIVIFYGKVSVRFHDFANSARCEIVAQNEMKDIYCTGWTTDTKGRYGFNKKFIPFPPDGESMLRSRVYQTDEDKTQTSFLNFVVFFFFFSFSFFIENEVGFLKRWD